MVSPWAILVVAGVFETAWAISLAYSEGFSKFWPSVATILTLAVSMVLLGKALEELPVGTAYAVWTGIGAVGTAVLGIALFDESTDLLRLGFISLVVVGIVGLQVTSH
jgi:quaternary ammonium compound-resistance protein SugE